MRRIAILLVFAAVALPLSEGRGAPEQRRPSLGYLYPAGAQRGTTVRIFAGGQYLRGARRVHVSGEGVRVKEVKSRGRPFVLNNDQRRLLGQRMRRRATALLTGRPARARPNRKGDEKSPEVKLPDHPLLNRLDELSLRELGKVRHEFFDAERRGAGIAQLAEVVEIELEIDEGAAPGDREVRVLTPNGLTNPLLFVVGDRPEATEVEPNDFDSQALSLPAAGLVLNGQVGHRDVDRFRFRARAGERLVIAAAARRLVPYLADAVPGWFQAVLIVRDEHGREVGYADDYRFDPDPVLDFDVPADGEYELEIRDAIHRGREDFVYRVSIGEARPGGEGGARPLPRAGDEYPEIAEMEPNDLPARAQPLSMPVVVSGRIEADGDEDLFRIRGEKGQTVVAEVRARRAGSPLDSLLRIRDAEGKVLALCDDFDDPAAGLVTHQADSYLMVPLPADGEYVVELTDARRRGGESFAYRLRVGPPRPDFDVLVTPSSVNTVSGSARVVTAHAVRRDGFAGPIDLELTGAPEGFFLSGGRIPAGRDRVRLTLTTPGRAGFGPLPIRITATARVGERTIAREAIPADDRMQAFGTRHLVAARELLVVSRRVRRSRPPPKLASEGPVRLSPGGTAEVRVVVPGLGSIENYHFQPDEPPAGVSVAGASVNRGVLVLTLAAEPDAAPTADNLIVDVYVDVTRKSEDDSPPRTTRYYAGALPAIPLSVKSP